MKISFSDLWRTGGTTDRGTYALVGLLGFALKHNLDRFVAYFGFHRPWGLFNYWVPVRDVARITDLHGPEAQFVTTMAAISLPFIWVGVALTIKRLRSAGLSTHLAAFFFLPFLNLLFFLTLCVLPERQPSSADNDSRLRRQPRLARFVPASALGSAAISLLVTVPIGLATTLLGTQWLANYGWGVFVAIPFSMGFGAAVVYGVREPRSLGGCIGVACLSVSLLGVALFALAIEGLICLIMATPIALPLAAFGGLCAYHVQKRQRFRNDAPVLLSALLLFAPGVELTEHEAEIAAPISVVRSSIDIQAPPEKVWHEVVAFSEIPPPTDLMFRVGVAYPIRAEMIGTGVGAERHCVFSTGTFVEPIQIWDEPRQLKFSVTSTPAPLEEWTPYSHIDPPHLHGYLISEGGQFLLTPLPSGGTRLEGTTWYRHGLWPASYWEIWSDTIIHQIHMRVLRHIRDKAERT